MIDNNDEPRSSLGREMKNLIKSAKESKILTEFIKIESKKRKSRRDLVYSKNKRSKTPKNQKIIERKKSSSCHRMDTDARLRFDLKDFENFCENYTTAKVIKRRASCPPANTCSNSVSFSQKNNLHIKICLL